MDLSWILLYLRVVRTYSAGTHSACPQGDDADEDVIDTRRRPKGSETHSIGSALLTSVVLPDSTLVTGVHHT